MSEYRRRFVPGGTYFFTIVTYDRAPLFSEPSNVARLRSILAVVRREHPFDFVAAVVLPDHMHFLWTLPPGDVAYPKRIGVMKAEFTKALAAEDGPRESPTLSRFVKRERDVWQRKYWEHTIADADDMKSHLDYIHYNPVKHSYVDSPKDWPYSSFRHWVARGEYDLDWGGKCVIPSAAVKRMDKIASRVSE